MKIALEIDDATGAMQLFLDPPNVPPPIVSWMLRKAEAAVFAPPTEEPKRVAPVSAAALRKLPGMNGQG